MVTKRRQIGVGLIVAAVVLVGVAVVSMARSETSTTPQPPAAPTAINAAPSPEIVPPVFSVPGTPPPGPPDTSATPPPGPTASQPSRIVDPNPGEGPDWPIPRNLVPDLDPDVVDRSVPIVIGDALVDFYGPLPPRPSAAAVLPALPAPSWATQDPTLTTELCALLPIDLVASLINSDYGVYVDRERGEINCRLEDTTWRQRVVVTITKISADTVIPTPYDNSVWERYEIAGQTIYTYTREQQIMVQVAADGWMLDMVVYDEWGRLSTRGGVATAVAAALMIDWTGR